MFPEGRALEFLIAAVVALIVVGPKDLPILLRKLGQFMARLRGMAAEFRASFDEMARQSELDELRKEVEALRRGQYETAQTMHHEIDQAVQGIHDDLAEVGVDLHGHAAAEAAMVPAPEEPAPPKPKRRAPAKRKAAGTETGTASRARPRAAKAKT